MSLIFSSKAWRSIFIFIQIGCFYLSGSSEAIAIENKAKLPSKKSFRTLDSILPEFDESNQKSMITFKLSTTIEPKEVSKTEYHGSFLQINIQNTLTTQSGLFIDGKSALIPKLAIFQVNPSTTGVRIFLGEHNDKLLESTKVNILKDHIVVTIDEQLVAPLATAQTASKETSKLDDIAILTPKPSNEAKLLFGLVTKKQVYRASLFFGGFFALVLLGLTLNKVFRKNRKITKKDLTESESLIRTLDEVKIGGKHKVSLLEIGGQQILLSTGGESIDFLTTINDKPALPPSSMDHSALPAAMQQQNIANYTASAPPLLKENKNIKKHKLSTNTPAIDTSPSKKLGFNKYLQSKEEEAPMSKSQAEKKLQDLIRNKLRNLPKV